MKNFRIFLFNVILLFPALMFAQQTVTGTVTESAGNTALPGVGIMIKGSTVGTSTDFDGNYTLDNVKVGDILVFSYMGFLTHEFTVGNETTTINVALVEDAQALDEVVVVGYGTTTIKDATGSVTSVKPEDLNKGAIISPDQMLTGKVAGVSVISNGGAPGAGSTIRIRGGASLNASNSPLFVIDGVPVDSDGISGLANPLTTINPNDIESYTILKDASATAIYGSRASNGVIIIITKKGGTNQELQGTYTSSYFLNQNSGIVDALSRDQFVDYITTNGAASDIALLTDANTNWQDEIFQIGLGTDQNLSLSGGTENLNMRGSIGYTNQSGTILTSKMERITGAFKIGSQFGEEELFKIDLNLKASSVKNRFADTGAISNAISFDPTKPVRDNQSPYGGYWQWLQPPNDDGVRLPIAIGAPINPVAQLEQRRDEAVASRFIGNIQFDWTFKGFEDLRANLNIGYDTSASEGDILVSDESSTTVDTDGTNRGEITEYTQNKSNVVWDLYLNYVNDFNNSRSNLDAMVGYSYQDFVEKGMTHSDLQDEFKDEDKISDYYNQLNLQSFFGRIKYGYAEKYLITLTYRRDGSSRFVGDNQWGNFPSAAFAWKIYEEDFLSGSAGVSNLKLRLSWGITGQQDIGSYYPGIPAYLLSNDQASYQFGNSYYHTYRAEPYNTTLKWEETTTYNIGVDFGFWDDLLTGSIDAYYRDTQDLLNFIPYPAGSALSNADNANIGSMENKGIEFTFNINPVRTDDWNLNFGLNATYTDTKITKLTTNDDPGYEGVETGGFSGGVGNTIQRHTVGYAPSSFFVFEQVYDASGKPLEGVYVDRNDDGVVDIKDKYRYEKPAADWAFGLTTDLTYKNWDFTMAWRAHLGNYVYNNVDSNLGFGLQFLNSAFPDVISNGVEDVLTTEFMNGGPDRYLSDYYIQDASFAKLDNISLAFNFRDMMNGDANIRLSGTVQNVVTITDYTGLDPEVSGGIDYNIYPRPVTYMIGAILTF